MEGTDMTDDDDELTRLRGENYVLKMEAAEEEEIRGYFGPVTS